MFNYIGIDHVQVAAPPNREDDAITFYSGKLGMELIEKPKSLQKNGGVWFQCGNHQLHIGVKQDFIGETKAHPAFEIENFEEFKDHLREQNVSYKEDDKLPDADRVYVFDPFGNRLEFLSYSTKV
ncbi:VOC family protein [Pontibacillus marinus]|uniref:Glyoxalase n=1 Tax=Pontibacillus marinus BH030004 = DSM 16465 TaxID=1385511 RepID=A0A0A5FWS0_9BACI|nr:VOC family protein [Pontibacillus marinus]KGX85246.1 glyoxalase [Pontibacillus marinus BH030004 = DSM 16465]